MTELFHANGRKTILGMVHLKPLPGTPYHSEGSLGTILDDAVRSAVALRDGGADGCLIQTVDRVYSTEDEADPARVAAMALVVRAVVEATGGNGFQVGVQLMRNAVKASLAVAKVAEAGFVRVGTLVGATLTAQGLVQANPLEVMEYRQKINAQDVRIIADADSMHFSWLGGGRPTGRVAKDAQQAGADAICVSHADEQQMLDMVASARRSAPALPVLLAGNTTHDNAARLLAVADGAFVGTCLELDGWGGPIDVDRVKAYMEIVRGLER
ncbi:BtpA/SgcQ family protein [Streptomyces sp. NPDC006333]|uniref:BtpA/SgcQ family protein n=1 Tax=Streptomyces sp. NPDC006333 TaxID=3156753 RepID=UPI0033BEB53F